MKADRKKLELAMARACMDSADLPTAVGLPRSTVHNVIVGKSVWPATLGCIAKALGVDPAELMEEAHQNSEKKDGCLKTECRHFDELPAILTATELAGALGISKAGAYTLIHSKGFPTLRIGKRLMVPKGKHWICMAQIHLAGAHPCNPTMEGGNQWEKP